MTRFLLRAFVPALIGLLASASPALAGGALETVDVTAGTSTFGPPFLDAPLVPIKWDARCIPVAYTLDDVPPTGLTLATGQATLQAALNRWRNINTSFWRGDVTAVDPSLGTPLGAFDFINEVNFTAVGGFLAISPSVSLLKDVTLAPGDDIDQDGDSDVFDPVVAGVNRCRDDDADGDIEFPAGSYEAGTILDNDVSHNNGVTWTVGPPDGLSANVDLEAVSTHEFGHSHGLSHSFINQLSGANAGGATMFPFIDSSDPNDELAQRSLETDDIAWSSYTYPEGSAASGPGALQPGDVPFKLKFALIQGEVTRGQDGLPVAGANVYAQKFPHGEVVVSAFSGTAQLVAVEGALTPSDADASLFLPPTQAFGILDGHYTIPAPLGLYQIGLQALDGLPAGAGNISLTAIVGASFGQLDFEEELWNGPGESGSENRPGLALPILALPPFSVSGIDLVSNVTDEQQSFQTINAAGFTAAPGGRLYAVRFANADVLARLTAGATLHTGTFGTFVVDASVAPIFSRALLATGSLGGGGTAAINLASPLRSQNNFVGQASDETPFFFALPNLLSSSVASLLTANPATDLFLVLEVPAAPFPGFSGIPPLIGLDTVGPFSGNSFVSDDGGVTFNPVTIFDFSFLLVFTP